MKQDSNLADSQPILVRIRSERLDVQLMDTPPHQAINGFFDAQAKFHGKVLNELIRFATDLESAFRLNVHQFRITSLRFSVSPLSSSP